MKRNLIIGALILSIAGIFAISAANAALQQSTFKSIDVTVNKEIADDIVKKASDAKKTPEQFIQDTIQSKLNQDYLNSVYQNFQDAEISVLETGNVDKIVEATICMKNLL